MPAELNFFDTKGDRSGRVVTRVKKSGARQALDHAFEAKMGSHYGIYERQGEKRFPVKEPVYYTHLDVYKRQAGWPTTTSNHIDRQALHLRGFLFLPEKLKFNLKLS